MPYSNILANFDIDGTLLIMWGVHTAVYACTVEELYGIKGFNFREHYETGCTVQETVVSNLKHAGHSDNFINKGIARVPELMAANYQHLLSEDSFASKITVLPGVIELLERLNKENILAGVITGNRSEVARLMLQRAGLSRYLLYLSTADDGETREQRIMGAIGKAQEISGFEYEKRRVFFFDDADKSILVSRKLGIRPIAVCTGELGRDALERAKPDYLLDDLADTEGIIGILKE
ncbi:MAG: HAD hydrolase-like protein [Candidatus Micrarchaeota archaeon]|nr:HAD hydrolase-like protein [Candidatus Micrarchaeota archaeon]